MATPTIAHGLDGEWDVLSLQGRAVLLNHERLAALVRVHVGQEASQLFAKPDLDAANRPIAWRSPRSGRLEPVPPGPSEVRARFQRRRDEILALATTLSRQGEAGLDAARSLRAALTTPTGVDGLYADGGEPVLVHWGLIRPGQVVDLGDAPETGRAGSGPAAAAAGLGAVAQAPNPTPPSPAPSGPVAKADAGGGPGSVGAPPVARAAFPWVPAILCVVLLAVAGWLLLQALNPLDPVVVDVSKEGPVAGEPLDGALSAAEAELARLDQAIAEARQAEDVVLDACVVPPPEPEPPSELEKVEVPPPTPPVPAPVKTVEPPPAEAALPVPPPTPPVKPDPPKPQAAPKPPREPVQAPAVPTPAPSPAPTASACAPTWSPGREPRMVFVVDGSGSMGDGIPGASSRLDAAKRSIRETIDALHPDIKAGLVSFSDCADTKNSEFYAYSQRPALMSRVDGMRPGRATSLAASIRRGGLLATRRSETVIMVVSDGTDTCGGDPCAAARQVKAEKPQAIIHVLDLSGGTDGGVARCIANAGGGRVYTPNTAAQVTQQLQAATGQPDTRGCR
jgi:hypothetical protein